MSITLNNFTKLIFNALLFPVLILLSSCDTQNVIFVSPGGNDNADASEDNPVKTLDAAFELMKKDAGRLPTIIYLDDGTYFLKDPIKFTLSVSGRKDAPIIWKALPGKNPLISGGIKINNWKIINENLWSAKLPDSINTEFRSLYVNDRRATRARYPDTSYLRIKKSGTDKRTNFFFYGNDIPIIDDINNLELVLFHDWSITRIAVKAIDWEKNQLTAVDSTGARLPFFNIDNWEKHPRYFLENSMQFCDSPGEWYCDFDTRIIYYRPISDEDIENIECIIPAASKIITLNGEKEGKIKYINFEDITFAHTSFTIPPKGYCGIQASMFTNRSSHNKGWDKVPAAIELKNADNIVFSNCTIKHTGGSGISIGSNSKNCQITGLEIYDISGNGINIGEGNSRKVSGIPWWKSAPEEICSNNQIINSTIKDCGRQFFGAVGIWCGLVSHTEIAENEISDLPYSGISIGWVWDTTATPCGENRIMANHIHNVMLYLSDGGAIYSLGRQPGSKILNNIIHHVKINAGRAESNGMFLDEGTTDLEVENNIIYNIAKSPLRFHRAFKNIVRRNILATGEGIPAIRYNRTKETDIKKIDNILLRHGSDKDMYYLKKILAARGDPSILHL